MKFRTQREKWVAAILGGVCLVLLGNLLRTTLVGVGSSSPPGPRAPARPAVAASPGSGLKDLARYNPEIRLDRLDDFDSRPAPPVERNPFEFGPTEAEKRAKDHPTPPSPPPPPPPPPITVKAMGFKDGPDGVRIAFFEDEELTYSAHEGESFANRYKVLKIAPTGVTIEDQSSHQQAQLPYPD